MTLARAIILVLLFVSTSGLRGQTTSPSTQPLFPGLLPEDFLPDTRPSMLGRNDLIQINVLKQQTDEDSNQSVRIGDDGVAKIDLIGNVIFNDKTKEQAESAIQSAYEKIIGKVQVNIVVLESRQNFFVLLGEFSRPGQYEISPNLRLFDALELAHPKAKKWNLRIIRDRNRVIDIPADAIDRRDPKVNIIVWAGDIYDLGWKDVGPTGEYYLGGDVKRTGVYSLNGRTVTLKKAIISAGVENNADYVSIIRKEHGQTANLLSYEPLADILSGKTPDMQLHADDEIMISKDHPPDTQPAR